MSKIDEFESLFKSATKPVFHVSPVTLNQVLILVDRESDLLGDFIDRIKQFLSVLNSVDHTIEFEVRDTSDLSNMQHLLDMVNGAGPDLICTYRNLNGSAIEFPYSLGEAVDVLTQATDIPVLLLPRPEAFGDQHLQNSDRVMLMTDHLAGDDRLVTFGAMFTQDHGELILAHVEDEQTFDRYIQVISKIPEIDTDLATEQIMEQLLKEPRDFITSCQEGLKEAGLPLTVKPVIAVGHHLSDYKKLVQEHEVDLLVLHTKDEDQLAMHGLAYPVSIELRDVPLLLI
ncbi:MAG: hypothetical protein AAGA30_05215 [Planctomycetota bacterium]